VLARIRRQFLGHWFVGVFAIIAVIWVITLVAYALGFKGVSFRNKFTGQDATIDFMRQHDRVFLQLADDVGLELNPGGPHLSGTIVKLSSGLPGLCWVCGDHETAGGIAIVDYRLGDWLFRAPFDNSKNSEVEHGRPESRAFILTIAYDRASGERVQVAPTADLAAQQLALSTRGLVPSDAARIDPENLADLPVVSMQREGCVIFNMAFVAVTLLWLVLGRLALLLVRVVRARRRR
jgi:hypothetical protein